MVILIFKISIIQTPRFRPLPFAVFMATFVRLGFRAFSSDMGNHMNKSLVICAAVAAIAFMGASQPVQAGSRDGAIAAGVLGGLAAGAIIGGAAAQPRYYEPGPAPAYVVEPGYGPQCYYTRGRAVWDDYRGVWVRPRARVCN
jgi:hypothetical protein